MVPGAVHDTSSAPPCSSKSVGNDGTESLSSIFDSQDSRSRVFAIYSRDPTAIYACPVSRDTVTLQSDLEPSFAIFVSPSL